IPDRTFVDVLLEALSRMLGRHFATTLLGHTDIAGCANVDTQTERAMSRPAQERRPSRCRLRQVEFTISSGSGVAVSWVGRGGGADCFQPFTKVARTRRDTKRYGTQIIIGTRNPASATTLAWRCASVNDVRKF